jgi:preprotein translocase subunit SecE
VVYRGGLENRFGLTPNGGSNPSLSARINVNKLTNILIWVAIFGAIFGVLWWQGQLKRLAAYVAETREELKKCTWPTVQELKGSTVVVMASILLLGIFTVVVDQVLFLVFFKIL